jgi:uridylate kinase
MSATRRGPWDLVLLKLSGEALRGPLSYGIHRPTVGALADAIITATQQGVRFGVIIGGGNIWRGQEAAEEGMDRATADYAGMVATVINAIALQDALERDPRKPETRLMTAIEMREVAEPFIRRRAIRHLEKGRIVLFAAGSGNPFFTTDTAAVLRASEIGAQVILKATNVDGVYDRDPRKHADARFYPELSHQEALAAELKVMDATAFALAKDNALPIVVFNVTDPQNIVRAAVGEPVGTLVYTPAP